MSISKVMSMCNGVSNVMKIIIEIMAEMKWINGNNKRIMKENEMKAQQWKYEMKAESVSIWISWKKYLNGENVMAKMAKSMKCEIMACHGVNVINNERNNESWYEIMAYQKIEEIINVYE